MVNARWIPGLLRLLADYGGKVEVEIRPFDFIAAATVQQCQNGKWIEDRSDVVGVELGEGFFQVLDDFANCHGIVRDGASWDECLDLLLPELRSRVVKPERQTDQDHNRGKGELVNV
jgi:hypothetical protein